MTMQESIGTGMLHHVGQIVAVPGLDNAAIH